MPKMESTSKVSLGVDTVGILDLPKFDQGKRLTCPSNTTITEVIQFLSKTLNFEKQFLFTGSFEPLNYVEIVMPVAKKGVKEESKTLS